MLGIASKNGHLLLADGGAQDVACAPVTVIDAFREALKLWMDVRGYDQTELSKRSGLTVATISKMLPGETERRDFTSKSLEQLRKGLNLQPRDLFDPDAALSKLGLSRKSDRQVPKAHTPLDLGGLPDPESASPLGGVTLMSYENAHALAELLDQWRRLTPEARMSLVLESVRLAKAPGTAAAKAR